MWQDRSVGVAIPAYRAARRIEAVLTAIPAFVDHVVVVDDASDDETHAVATAVAGRDPRIQVVRHATNQGVGGATLSGFSRLLELRADVVFKIDADGQMDPVHMPKFLEALGDGRRAYAKGNRFHDRMALASMPRRRWFGNFVLTFLTKAVSGYWNVSDPQNGYLAIDRRALAALPMDDLARRWFFENDLLVHLNILEVPVAEVPIPAVYEDERSNLRIGRVLTTFPFLLFHRFWRRIWRRYVVFDSSPVAVLLLAGLPLCVWGVAFGAFHWARSIQSGVPATTGTVMVSVLPLVLGFQMLLQALLLDIQATPR